MVESGFYDLNVYSVPDDSDKVCELAAIAKHLGYSGIAINDPDPSIDRSYPAGLAGIGIFSGVQIKIQNSSKLHGIVEKFRNRVDIITVHGGNESINRAAVENPKVDILTQMNVGTESGFNHVLAKEASDNKVAISFDLGDLIRLRGGSRVHVLSNFRKDLQLVRKYDVPFLLTSSPRSWYDMRAPRELIALASLFGMSREEAISGLTVIPQMLISRSCPPVGYLCEGVQVIRTELISEGSEGLNGDDVR
ncbi:ribonuclease P protein component 3 [Methanolobus halotolerans]|uniref:Ribonuclease P protein component 3 n=1 Tax=Methanolobus halotolerans TaxID=2052935 RepID=A0A4E0QBJ3_9EURY|nr:RNase P subunit p30 family protein [Methanolobus halotolerans]TGC10544.1 ribonuclease P protein component 3 [Methanolobus halotolerans]